MYDFSNFLEDIKLNRDSEIRAVISKGYSCSAKSYKFFDYFVIEWFGQKFEMSLFSNNSETNFLVVEDSLDEDGSTIKRRSRYYSMVGLFDQIIKRDFSSLLLKAIQSSLKSRATILYKSNVYSFEIPTFTKREFNKINKNDRSLLSLFLTFFLIQNKSNNIFRNNIEYIDGIYRFFQVYTTVKYDSIPMKKRGWFFNEEKFKYKRYLEMRIIRLVYDGKTRLKEEREFSKQLSSSLSNEDALLLFLNEFNRLNGTNISKEDALNNKTLFFVKSDALSLKEVDSCDSIKPYYGNKDRCFRLKGVAVDVNIIVHHFMISKFNKKYYLTNNELNEIISSDPSESSINDRSEGSDSL